MLIVVENLVSLDRIDDVLALLDKEIIILLQVASEGSHFFPEIQELLFCRLNLEHEGLNPVSRLLEKVVQAFHLGDSLRLFVRNLTREIVPDVVFALSTIEDDFESLHTLSESILVDL